MQSNHGDSPHKFVRIKNKSGVKMYRCAKDGCPTLVHYEIIQGRKAECWRCRSIFTITRKTLRNKYLHCNDCTLGHKKDNTVDKLLDGIFNVSTEFESKDLK